MQNKHHYKKGTQNKCLQVKNTKITDMQKYEGSIQKGMQTNINTKRELKQMFASENDI